MHVQEATDHLNVYSLSLLRGSRVTFCQDMQWVEQACYLNSLGVWVERKSQIAVERSACPYLQAMWQAS